MSCLGALDLGDFERLGNDLVMGEVIMVSPINIRGVQERTDRRESAS